VKKISREHIAMLAETLAKGVRTTTAKPADVASWAQNIVLELVQADGWKEPAKREGK
jgi:hypothetical protein